MIGGDNDLTINTPKGRRRIVFAPGMETLAKNLSARLPARACLGYVLEGKEAIEGGGLATIVAEFQQTK